MIFQFQFNELQQGDIQIQLAIGLEQLYDRAVDLGIRNLEFMFDKGELRLRKP